MPGPVSLTMSPAAPSRRDVETEIAVPSGVCVKALSIRIRMICATRSGSASAGAGSPAHTSIDDPCCEAAGPNSAVNPLGEGSEVDVLGSQLQCVGIELREVEQVPGQLGQAIDLPAHLADE